jgi:lipoprotein
MKRLLILSLALVLVGYATSSCSSSALKDKERNDSIVVAELEAARLDSIRQDSIARRNFITPDLAFNDLHGDVKKCVCDNNEYLTYTYDENGKWTNEPQWNESDKKFCPDRTKHPRAIRNKDGYITRIYWECDADYEYEDISWKDGRVKTRFNSTYSYDNDFIITQENEEEYDAQVTYTYCNYEVDDMGNWVKRDVIEKITDTYQNSVRYEKKTETRNITYHKSNGEGRTTIPNNAKQEQALQALKSYSQKKVQEDNKGPEWINGIWEVNTTISTAMGSMKVSAKVCIDRNSQQLVATDCDSTVARGIYRISGNSIYCGDLYIEMDMSNERLEYGNGVYYRKVSNKYL